MPQTSIPLSTDLTPRQAWEALSASGLDLWTVDDVLRVMPVPTSRASIYKRAQSGTLPFNHLRVGRFYRFRPADVSAYLRGVYGMDTAAAR